MTTENEDKVPQQQGEPSTDAPAPAPRSGGYSSERSGGYSSDRGGHSGLPADPAVPIPKIVLHNAVRWINLQLTVFAMWTTKISTG